MVRVQVSKDFGPLELELTEEDMRDVGEFLIRTIRTRTEAGTDVHGVPFRPYSLGYAKQKSAALGHSKVDLTVSGRMLNDMHVTAASKTGCTISFVSQGGGNSGGTFIQRSRSLGAADKAEFNNPSREFFAISDAEAEDVAERLGKALERRMNEGSK